jgi:hypothetical protein
MGNSNEEGEEEGTLNQDGLTQPTSQGVVHNAYPADPLTAYEQFNVARPVALVIGGAQWSGVKSALIGEGRQRLQPVGWHMAVAAWCDASAGWLHGPIIRACPQSSCFEIPCFARGMVGAPRASYSHWDGKESLKRKF